MREYVLNSRGGIKCLKLENAPSSFKLRKGEVLVKHKAIGINYFDVHFRKGDYKIAKTPAILGLEACGVVEEVGPEVVDFEVGERVAYATGPVGSYVEKRVVNQRLLISVPNNLTDVQVAGSLVKGLMAHTLLFRVYVAQRAKRILVHAAAGGVGQFLCSWAKYLGLEVIGTVGSNEKIAIAKAAGCDHVINYETHNFLKEVERITNAEGVGIVYDGVGKKTLFDSIDCLWPMGVCVSYGESSGTAPQVDLNRLLLNSLYITRPTLALYKAKRAELALSAAEVFDKITKGIVRPNITTYRFEDLPRAHRDLESRKSTGSLVVTL